MSNSSDNEAQTARASYVNRQELVHYCEQLGKNRRVALEMATNIWRVFLNALASAHVTCKTCRGTCRQMTVGRHHQHFK